MDISATIINTSFRPHSNNREQPLSMEAIPHSLTRVDIHCGTAPICGAFRRFVSLAFCCLTLHSVSAAPYPPDGMPTEWVQPDGTPLKLKVFGDEFYGRTTTLDGYTVIFAAADMTYYYAITGADGKSLVASDVTAGRKPPENLTKQLRESDETVTATRAANIREYVPERAANWAARVKAVQLRRAGAAGLAPAPDAAGPALKDDILGAPVSGVKLGLVILVQFPDDPATAGSDPTPFPTTQAKMTRFCNEAGYTDDGNTGSIRDYYYDQSNSTLTFTQVVTPVVMLPHPRNYYNYSDYPANTTLPDCGTSGRLMVADAIAILKSDGFDFSTLTVDSGHRVIATSLLYAGNTSGVWAKGLWPHSSSVSSINVGTSVSPRYVSGYQASNVADAAAVIGTVCHELGHLLLDYPDFYDTDSTDGDSEGVGEHCLMGSGNHLNSDKTPAPIDLYLKDFSGWANITDLTINQPIDAPLPSTGNRGYRIRRPNSNTEYFLFENRGAGDKWANYSPDKGIVIWHVDESVTSANQHQQRTASQHYELSLEQADGLFDLENNRNRGDNKDLFDLSDGLFNNVTSPNAKWWDGTVSGISTAVLSAPGASMNVRFGVGYPIITSNGQLPDGLRGEAYNQPLAATGGTPPYTWSLTGGSLPSGLSLSAAGVISGTPAVATSASFTVQVTTNSGLVASKVFSLAILASMSEALDQAELVIASSGNLPWVSDSTTTFDGVDSVRSGAITHSQTSVMQTTVTGPGMFSFCWKVSSENDCDYLTFYIDDVAQSGAISGSVGWQLKSYAVRAGNHTLKWIYSKDDSVNSGSDCGWVDQLTLPVVRPVPYTYVTRNGAITITGYTGSGEVVSIPATIDNLPVTGIGNRAFSNCSSLVRVTIPNGVTVIGDAAFAACDSLTGVTIPASVTSIGISAFACCTSLAGVLIPNSVITIGNGAFSCCNSLGGVTIPASVTRIGDQAFRYCAGLTGVSFMGDAPWMGVDVFGDTASGFTVYYINGKTGFASPSWYGYTAISMNASLPPVVTTEAASGITASGVTLNGTVNPNGLASTAHFEYGLTTTYGNTAGVTLSPDNGSTAQAVSASLSGLQPGTTYHYRLIATNGGGSGSAADMMFSTVGAEDVYAYTVTNGMIDITGYTGPGGVLVIPSVIGGQTVTSIGYLAFYGCANLASVTIPAGVTRIGDGAFAGCTSLSSITVDAQNADYGSVGGVLFNKSQTTLIQYPGGKTGNYTIPNHVTAIGYLAFYGCANLAGVTIPASVTGIGELAFAYCGSLTSASFIGNAPTMGLYVFESTASGFKVYYYMNRLGFSTPNWMGCATVGMSRLLPPAVTAGAASAITTSSATLQGTVNPNGLASSASFDYGTTDAYGSTAGVTIFPDNGSDAQTVSADLGGLQAGTIYHYRLAATNDAGTNPGMDMTFATVAAAPYTYTLSNGTITITGYTGSGGVLVIPSAIGGKIVTLIGDRAFYNCASLSNVTIPAGVTGIADLAFGSCTSLTRATFLGNAPTMGASVFDSAGSGFKVYYYSNRTGFTSPSWTGYTAVSMTPLLPPAAITNAASGITAAAVTLNGTVNPNGQVSTARFDYGLTTSYGSTADVTLTPDSGSLVQAVSASLGGLPSGTTYHYRIVATNGSGTVQGADRTFITTVVVPSTYTAWIATFVGLSAADRAMLADPDHDGLGNAVEMVLGGNPATIMNASLLPTIQWVTHPGGTMPFGDYLLFAFRRTLASVMAGITSGVQYGPYLAGPWNDAFDGVAGVIVLEDGDFYGTGVDRVRVYMPRGANPKVFARLRVRVP